LPLTTINGYQHFYEDAGSGDAVVLLHGNENSSYYFKRIIPALSDQFHVIAPHFRGMGFSEHVDTVPPGAWLDDLLALLDELGIESAHCFGVSLGAAIGMRLALEHPDRVRTLTLDAPFFESHHAAASANVADTVEDPPPWIVAEFRAMHGDDWRTVMRCCDRILGNPELAAYLSIGNGASAITSPTLIMRGDAADPFHPLADALRLHDVIHTSRLWIAPDTLSLITRHLPSETLRTFSDFALDFSRVTSGSSSESDPHSIDILTRVDLFAGLRRDALARLAAIARKTELRAGETVFEQGEPAGEFSVVTHGAFGVFTSTEDGQAEALVQTLQPGQFFGEVALIAEAQHTATVRCAEDGVLLQIDGRHFRALLERDATAAMAVATQLSRFALAPGNAPHE
jgi:pimeloyl-ACP methyl ester carboxylesterase